MAEPGWSYRENEVTLHTYEKHADAYIHRMSADPPASVCAWLDEAVRDLSRGALILELGSGTGRDARYIEKQGYAVLRTDATAAFVQHLRQGGFLARRLNALTDPLGGPYHLILADAVILHFPKADALALFRRVRDALLPKGRLAFSVQQGSGQMWRDLDGGPRYFCLWESGELTQALSEAGFSMRYSKSDEDFRSIRWMNLVVQPASAE